MKRLNKFQSINQSIKFNLKRNAMRKSFTLLFSTLMLICAFGISSFAAAPQLAGTDPLLPADGNNNVKPTTTEFVVTFNQDVKFTATGGTFTITKGTTLVKTITLAAGSTNASISGKVLTVTHGLTLTEGAGYSLGITSNAIENAAGEKFAGIAAGAWTFTIGDYTGPVVKTLDPENGEPNVDVSPDFILEVEFEDANGVVPVNGKKVWVYKADGTIVDIVSISEDNTSMTGKTASILIDGDAYFDELTSYYVNIEPGAFVDNSPNANKFAGIMNKTTWTFSSMDYSAAYVVSKSVTNITGSSATLNVTINEPGTVYYVVLEKGDEPSMPHVINGTGWESAETDANNSISVVVDKLNGGPNLLEDGTEYTVYIVAENEEGDTQSVPDEINFTTLDTTAPIAASNKEVAEDNVTVGVQLTFNEEVVPGTGDLLIKLQSNNATVRTIAAADVVIEEDEDNDGWWIMTASFAGLESETGYYVIIPTGFVKDVAGNNYVSTFNTTVAWQFTSSDFIAPTVEVSIDESDPPVASDNILIEFSEDVKLVDGTDITTKTDQASWFNYIAFELNNVALDFTASYSNGTITLDPAAALQPNKTYVVKIRANAFEDLSENPFSAVHTSYELTTGDFGDATIAYEPLDGATAVEQGTQPTITFSKEAKYVGGSSPAAITAANIKASITLKEDNDTGDDVDFTVTWDAASRTITVVPDEPLESEGVYYLAFDFTDVEDVYGEPFADPGTSTFTMIDYIVPTVEFSHEGTVDDMAADADLTIEFSEDVTLIGDVKDLVIFKKDDADGANLGFAASWDGLTNTITISPSADLEDGKTYYYGIGAGVASDGVNKNAAAYSTFTFAPAVPDILDVATYVPAIEATGVKTNTSGDLVATLTFTEAVKANPVMPTNHDAVLYDSNDNAVSTVAVSAGDFEGSKLTITFTGITLDSEGEYYITLDADVVVANANNSKTFAGIEADVWTFTAADTETPVLTVNTPGDTETGVAMDADVVIDVDEPVVAGTGNITIKVTANTTDTKTITVGTAVIDNEEGTITIPHTNFTQYGTEYTVTVPAGAFKDMAGNTSVELTWTFTTMANPVPTAVKFTPADDEDMVEAGTENFYIEFSEEVVKGASGTTAFLVKVGTGATRAVLNGDGTATANNDDIVGAILVDNATDVVVSGNMVTLNFRYELEEGEEYFILIEEGMFKDNSKPAAANWGGVSTYGEWNFFTDDVNAPEWEVSYVERGEGMDITSDIVITFSKPIEKWAGGTIASADVANLFTLTVGGTPIAFTGSINAEKTVVVLENNSFIPTLTVSNSGNLVSVAPVSEAIRGQVNHAAVSTIAETFNISDYDAPTATITNLVNTEGTSFEFDVESDEDGTVYWLVQEGDNELTAEVVKAGGTALEVEAGDAETVEVEDVESETEYTIYAVAEDETGNLSGVASHTFTTADITKPVVVNRSANFDADGNLYLGFSEDVDANGAVAVIRHADTKEIVATVALAAGNMDAGADSLVIEFAGVLAYTYPQDFIIEISGGVVKDLSLNANTWDGQIGLGANAWVVGILDADAPTLVKITPDLTKPVALDAVFTLEFNENVQLADEFEVLFEYWDYEEGEGAIFELLEASAISVSGNIVTLNPTRAFWPTEDAVEGDPAAFRFSVAPGSIEDLAGNPYEEGIQEEFVTVDNVAPVAEFDPEDGDDGVARGADLTITFSEAVVLLDGSVVDKFDLETLVYLNKGGVAVPHAAVIDVNAKVITIDPTTLMDYGAEYTYGITAGFMDDAGNEIPAQEATFTVITETAEEDYITFDPDNGDEEEPTIIPVDQAFRVIFNGQLYTYQGTLDENNIAVTVDYLEDVFVLADEDEANVPFTVSIESWTANETVIVITPDDDLESETGYMLAVLDDYLQIGVGNAIPLGDGDWTHEVYESIEYFTVDVTEPEAVAFVPEDGLTVGKSTTISIEFNEKVKAGTGEIKIYRWDGILQMTIDASTLVNGDDDEIIEITDLTELETNTEYYVIIPAGAITDLAGNPWEGIDGEDDWNFTVQDDVKPVITNIVPVGVNTPVNTALMIYFDRPVQLNTDDLGFIAIYDANGIAFQLIRVNDGTVNYTISADGMRVTIEVDELEEDTQYLVEVAQGTFVSAADPSLENDGVIRTMWTFSTETNKVPEVLSLFPDDDATNVNLSVIATMTFDIDVQPGTGTIRLHLNDGATVVHEFDVNSDEVVFEGNVVSFDLTGYLEDQAVEYYIIVPSGAITNISSDPEAFPGLLQTYSWNFTTKEDGAEPELVTWSPDDVTIEDNYPTFVMTFDKEVVLTEDGGNLVVTAVGAEEATLILALTEDMIDSNTVTVTYNEMEDGELLYGTEYFVTVDAGALQDLSENVWSGVSNDTIWTFLTYELTIADIQGEGDVSPMLNQNVNLTGTVTGVSAGEGFFMQDANAAWSGIWVEYADAADFTIGDGVTVVGVVGEVANVTTIAASEVTAAEAPVVVEAIVLDSPSAAKAEMYESVLVQVVGARGTAADEGNGEWTIYYEETDNVIVNDWLFVYSPVEDHFYHVTGIVNGRMESYKLEPRMASDIVDVTETTDVNPIPTAEFKVYPNPFNNIINIDNHDKLTRAIVTNIAGQRVLDVEYPDHVISTSNLRSGVYVISLYTEDGMAKSVRIVKR